MRTKHHKFTRMDAKLTLILDKQVIQRAKSYAATKKTSLSKLVESYLDSVTAEEKSKEEIPLKQEIIRVFTKVKKEDR